jgi:hypothetical protein
VIYMFSTIKGQNSTVLGLLAQHLPSLQETNLLGKVNNTNIFCVLSDFQLQMFNLAYRRYMYSGFDFCA